MLRKLIKSVTPLLLAGLFVACGGESAQETPPPTPQVITSSPVSQAESTGQVAAEGQIMPLAAADLSFQTVGKVAEILASEGQAVTAGAPLVRLDSAAAEATLARAQAGLAAAEAGVAAAQAQATIVEAQRRSAEAALTAAEAQLALVQARLRPEQRAAAERNLAAAEAGVAQAAAERDAALDVSDARVRAAEARLAVAQSQLTALQESYDTILTTCVELPDGSEVCPLLGAPEETVRAQLAAAEAGFNAAQLALAEARNGATPAEQQVAQASVDVAAAQRDVAAAQLTLLDAGATAEEVRLAEIGVARARMGQRQAEAVIEQTAAALALAEANVQNATAMVEEAQLALDRLTLTAPFAGTVDDVAVEVGELVAPGVVVARLADASRWTVETGDLVELDVVFIEVGQPATVTLDALPGEVLRGTVADIGRVPQVTRGDITYPVLITLEDRPDLPLRQGMTALVTMDAGG